MKNRIALYCKGGCENLTSLGDNWLEIKFNLEYHFLLEETDDILQYLRDEEKRHENWVLYGVGNNYNAILLKGNDYGGNTEYLLLEKEK